MGVRGAAALAAVAVSVLGLAACSQGGGSYGAGGGAAGGSTAPPSSEAPPSPMTSVPASGSDVLVAMSSSLGKIVVNGQMMTVYVFDKDTPNSGKSSCTGKCASTWPEVTSSSMTPQVSGVTGKVGTITGVDGMAQVTLDGHPLYTFANDSDPGEINGQGVGGVWWLVGPNGKKITKTASAGKSSTAGGYGGY
jgi:predicted lipoprotein with Yx(FWY)xxD motif